MATEPRTAYVDFTEKYNNKDTKIRIFETKTHVFVYVNQYPSQMHLYNEFLRDKIKKYIKRKEIVCVCNLESYDSLKPIASTITEIFKNK
ncbi:hypothetical protein EHP00_701 [Ecytonucleospora hepatopenaei]|uniref:Uncharacterized protein n=1 Tax=Ecytonucleospora hepatopenaei TaxID=646526 RepID=A0A1W0E3U3_9MICR|nr:hypothetical protein EHP00_701 [Ecytonucleospora hepatopenaei]